MATLTIKWSGQEYLIESLEDNETVADLKKAIQAKTGVLPGRMKLLGLKYKGTFGHLALQSAKLNPDLTVPNLPARCLSVQSVL